MDYKSALYWISHWGDTWDERFKIKAVIPFIENLSRENILGRNVIDLGSGFFPVTRSLSHEKHRVIEIDIWGDEMEDTIFGRAHYRFNIEWFFKNQEQTDKLLERMANFFGIPHSQRETPFIDCVIVSEVMNYVDYCALITHLHPYLKSRGRLVIVQWCRRRSKKLKWLFSPQSPENNIELLLTLFAEKYLPLYFQPLADISKPQMPWEDQMIVIVAQRKDIALAIDQTKVILNALGNNPAAQKLLAAIEHRRLA